MSFGLSFKSRYDDNNKTVSCRLFLLEFKTSMFNKLDPGVLVSVQGLLTLETVSLPSDKNTLMLMELCGG